MTTELVLPPVDEAFRAIAKTVVPEAETLSPEGWDELEAIVEDALSARPLKLRKQVRVLIRALDALAVLRYGRRLHSLPAGKRGGFLEAIQDSRIYKLRQGFWGLRTLVFMGYYARAEAADEIGYGARLRGWLEHPDAPEAARAQAGAGPGPGPGVAGRGVDSGGERPSRQGGDSGEGPVSGQGSDFVEGPASGQGSVPGGEPPSGLRGPTGDGEGVS